MIEKKTKKNNKKKQQIKGKNVFQGYGEDIPDT